MIDFKKAKYQATLVLQFTSLAELYLKDYEAELYKQGYKSKQMAKKRILDNARAAERLRLNCLSIEQELTAKTNENQMDDFLGDIGFMHNMFLLLIDRCGSSEQKRTMAHAAIYNMKSELNIL